mgnify:CR=1 FL=1
MRSVMRLNSIAMGTLLITILVGSLLISLYTSRMGNQNTSESLSSIISFPYTTSPYTVLPTTGAPIDENLNTLYYYGLIGNWSYSLVIYSNGTGTVSYTHLTLPTN